MLLSIILLLLSIIFGFSLSLFFDSNSNLLRRLSFSIVIGIFFSTWTVFIVSFLFLSLSFFTILLSVIILGLLTFFILKFKLSDKKIKNFKKRLDPNIKNWKKFIYNNKYYLVFIFVLIIYLLHFIIGLRIDQYGNIRCIDGFCSDAAFHMAIETSFLYKNNFPPKYPLYFSTNMGYPFLNDFFSAVLAKGGFPLILSIVVPNILLVFSFVTLTLFFIRDITNNKLLTSISFLIFFFCGIGFVNILTTLIGGSFDGARFDLNILNFNSVNNVVSYNYFNFTEILTNIFIPQRSYLIGFSLAIMILSFFYRNFSKSNFNKKDLFFYGIVAGLIPFFHAHSFIVISFTALFIFLYKRKLEWLYFFIPLVLLSLPQIYWMMEVPKVDYFFGFVYNERFWGADSPVLLIFKHFIFWVRVMGIPFVLGVIGFFLANKKLRIFFIPFLILFLAANLVRFQPSFGDNNKITLYFLLFMSIFSSFFLERIFKIKYFGKILVLLIIFLTTLQFIFYFNQNIFKAQLQKYDGNYYTNDYPVLFNKVDLDTANWIVYNTNPYSIFLTKDDFNSLVSLTGRTVVKGVYAWNLGVLINDPENDIRNIYSTGDCKLIEKYGINYILVGRHEAGIATFNFSSSINFIKVYENNERNANIQIFRTMCEVI